MYRTVCCVCMCGFWTRERLVAHAVQSSRRCRSVNRQVMPRMNAEVLADLEAEARVAVDMHSLQCLFFVCQALGWPKLRRLAPLF